MEVHPTCTGTKADVATLAHREKYNGACSGQYHSKYGHVSCAISCDLYRQKIASSHQVTAIDTDRIWIITKSRTSGRPLGTSRHKIPI